MCTRTENAQKEIYAIVDSELSTCASENVHEHSEKGGS